jgi:hypothetical protein
MRYIAYAGLALLFLMVAFVVWRITSVARGARRRDQRILQRLEPVGRRLEQNAPLDADEIRRLAARPEARGMLHELLRQFGQAGAFPEEQKTRQAHAEAMLAYWMMHPNELQDAPAAIELVEAVSRKVGQRDGELFVFRYRMPDGHWAGSDWLLGVAGPFFPGDVPYSDTSVATAWALASDKDGTVAPGVLVDRFIQLAERTAGGRAGSKTA